APRRDGRDQGGAGCARPRAGARRGGWRRRGGARALPKGAIAVRLAPRRPLAQPWRLSGRSGNAPRSGARPAGNGLAADQRAGAELAAGGLVFLAGRLLARLALRGSTHLEHELLADRGLRDTRVPPRDVLAGDLV